MNNFIGNQNLTNLFNGEIDLTRIKITNPSNTGLSIQSDGINYTGNNYSVIFDNNSFRMSGGSVNIVFDTDGLRVMINNNTILTINNSLSSVNLIESLNQLNRSLNNVDYTGSIIQPSLQEQISSLNSMLTTELSALKQRVSALESSP